MDNLTHTLIGVTAAQSGLSNRFGRGTTMVLAIASNLPDLDIFLPFLTGQPSYVIRRMVTHSFFSFPMLAAVAALVFRFIYKNLSYRSLFGLCLLAMALHVFFDLVNSYGVVALWPFSRQRYELAWIFIIDLVLWVLLMSPILLAWIFKNRVPRISVFRTFAILIVCYIGFCALSRVRSNVLLKKWETQNDRRPSFSYLFPEALGSHRFRAVIREENLYTILLTNGFENSIKIISTVPTLEHDPNAQTCALLPEAKNLLWFFKAPVWSRNEQTNRWILYDLRFQSVVIGRKIPFQFELEGC